MQAMPVTATQALGTFSAELGYADIPSAVARRAKDCIVDTVAAATFGAQLGWSRIVVEQYAARYGSGGVCSILGFPNVRVHAPYAALANGVLAHAFELDGPGVPGTHPGATLLPAVLAACEDTGADGRTALTAFVAGCEVMFRIGIASRHSCEQLGFHAPGLTGPYGSAVAAGRVLGLNGEQLAHALGIAGSLSSGLLAFTKSRDGAMVKRLHLGRAAESGILAARLAAAGYTGPETILEGRFGFLDTYCRDADPGALTAGLNETWETLRTCIKRYACHLYAHTPIQALRALMSEHGFRGSEVAHVAIEGSKRLLTHHDIREPADITKAQYSVPFCVALSLFRDPEDPCAFDASALEDREIRAACRRVELRLLAQGEGSPRVTRIHVRLKDGRQLSRAGDFFKGMPQDPLSPAELRSKFLRLCAHSGEAPAAALADALEEMESAPTFSVAALLARKLVKDTDTRSKP
ncbi:MAG: MmgE/PrpD family protein [Betaproteobacteria bacterium]|nr:MmgE/PrpD family protein [Betaproteobacteria bacterium]